jgi:hypothetical protein
MKFTIALRRSDQEAAIVGAKVERGEHGRPPEPPATPLFPTFRHIAPSLRQERYRFDPVGEMRDFADNIAMPLL